jgi:hypothetical protein
LEFLVGFSDAGVSNLHPLGKRFSLGGVMGAGWTNPFEDVMSPHFAADIPSGQPGGAFITSGSSTFVIGPMVEFGLFKNLSVEADALRGRLGASTQLRLDTGATSPYATVSNLTWEFPVLAKYRFANLFAKPGLRPFIEAGPAFRLLESQSSGTSPGTHGITAGAGFELKLGPAKIAPSVRYTRWSGQNYPPGFLVTLCPNQAAVLVGFSF